MRKTEWGCDSEVKRILDFGFLLVSDSGVKLGDNKKKNRRGGNKNGSVGQNIWCYVMI